MYQSVPKEWKVLSVGNSFAVDTMEHLAGIALNLGVERVKLGCLYVGGCSITMHHAHAMGDMPVYHYYTNDGSGWQCTPAYKISAAIASEQWDVISIQHGSKDGSRYTDPASYALLPALVEYIRAHAWEGVRIAFNMTWVGEPYDKHRELISYDRDQLRMYRLVTEITQSTVGAVAGIDVICPTGTAVQNARTSTLETVSRDGYHLTYDVGRYLAGLTFFGKLTGADIRPVTWVPEGVSAWERRIAVESAANALANPYEVTASAMKTGAIKNELHIGVEKPFTVIHLSDTHLTLADLRDGERKVTLAEKRAGIFPHAEEMLTLADELAEQYNAPILHTGDLIDFVSMANLERSRAFVDSHDLFMAAGNHEFSLYVGEAWEDAAYRNQSLAQVQESFDNDIRMSSRVIGGVNFIALDNGYYLFEEDQLAFLQSEAEKGLPMVLMMHNPLYEKEFYEQITYHREQIGLRPSSNLPCAYLTGVPAELMGHYDDHRRRQQTPDEVTLRTIEWIRSCPLIRAVLAGHVHYSHVAKLTEDVPQIITSVTDVRVITVM